MIHAATTYWLVVLGLWGLVLGGAGCEGNGGNDPGSKGPRSDIPIGALVTVLPQRPMVEAIGGEYVDVTVLVTVGQDPHLIEPMPSQLVAATQARVWFTVGSGVEYEIKNHDRIARQADGMRVVDCHEGIDLLVLGDDHGHDGHGEGHEGPGTTDPHIWLAPDNLRVMADHVRDVLVDLDPDHAATYRAGHEAYCAEVEQLHDDLVATLGEVPSRAFLTYHPAWGYFANRYGLRQVAIEQGGRQPGPAGIATAIEQAQTDHIAVILTSPLIDNSSARVIAAETGATLVSADPLAEDVGGTLRAIAGAIARGGDPGEPGRGNH